MLEAFEILLEIGAGPLVGRVVNSGSCILLVIEKYARLTTALTALSKVDSLKGAANDINAMAQIGVLTGAQQGFSK